VKCLTYDGYLIITIANLLSSVRVKNLENQSIGDEIMNLCTLTAYTFLDQPVHQSQLIHSSWTHSKNDPIHAELETFTSSHFTILLLNRNQLSLL